MNGYAAPTRNTFSFTLFLRFCVERLCVFFMFGCLKILFPSSRLKDQISVFMT